MVAEGCEEKTLTYGSTEELVQALKELSTSLKNAFSTYEPNKELAGNPQVWVNYIHNAIQRAHCFLKMQKDHPGLEDVFAKLETSLHHAEDRMPEYANKKGVDLPKDTK